MTSSFVEHMAAGKSSSATNPPAHVQANCRRFFQVRIKTHHAKCCQFPLLLLCVQVPHRVARH
jgi:hypothetical protein